MKYNFKTYSATYKDGMGIYDEKTFCPIEAEKGISGKLVGIADEMGKIENFKSAGAERLFSIYLKKESKIEGGKNTYIRFSIKFNHPDTWNILNRLLTVRDTIKSEDDITLFYRFNTRGYMIWDICVNGVKLTEMYNRSYYADGKALGFGKDGDKVTNSRAYSILCDKWFKLFPQLILNDNDIKLLKSAECKYYENQRFIEFQRANDPFSFLKNEVKPVLSI